MIALICKKKEQERLKMLLSEFGDVVKPVADDAFRETVKQILARGG